jgi:DHHC palmitoyltransferase
MIFLCLSFTIGLNTCVGDKNYRDFFRVMLSIFCMLIMHLSVATYLCVDLFLKGPTYDRANDVFGDDSSDDVDDDDKDVTVYVITALLLFGMLFDVVSLILLSQLIHFHIGLQRDKISTYQYIVRDHQRRRDKTKLENELQSQRVVQLQKYRAENKHCAARQLQWGHACRKMGCPRLDPMKLPPTSNNNNNQSPEATTTTNTGNTESKVAIILDDVPTTNGNGATEAAAAAAAAAAGPKPTVDVVPFAESLGAFASPVPVDLNNNDDYSCDDDTTANGSRSVGGGGGAAAATTDNEPTSGAPKSSSLPGAVPSSQPFVISWQPTAYSQLSASASSSSTSSSLMQNRVPSLHHATLLAPDDEDDDLTNYTTEDDSVHNDTRRSSSGGGVSFLKVNAANASSSPPPSSSPPINDGLASRGNGSGASSLSLATGSQRSREQDPTITGATTTTAVVSDAPPPPSSPTSYSSRSNVKPLASLSPPR